MPKKKQLTLVTIVLDESGSMQSIRDDTIGGFNTYLSSLCDKSVGTAHITLLTFDSFAVVEHYADMPAKKVAPLTRETYAPGQATPLYDAIMDGITRTEKTVKAHEKDKPLVVVVIQTDGHENASITHTCTDVQQAIKAKTAAGWNFVYLGAGIDAFEHAQQFAIDPQFAMSYGREKSAETFAAVSQNTTAYRVSGGASDKLKWSDTQRKAVT